MTYLYLNTPDNRARFVLGTEGTKPLIVMSINPSVGSATVKSPTVTTVRHIAEDYGYDSWIILCLYPQRATHLDELDQVPDPELVAENMKVIDSVLSRYPGTRIWAAWGTHYKDRFYFPQMLQQVLTIAGRYHDSWMHYGPLDEGGIPQYCLYLDKGEGWFPFNAEQFLETTPV